MQETRQFPAHFAFVHCTRSVFVAAGTKTSPVPEDFMPVAASRPTAEHELVELSQNTLEYTVQTRAVNASLAKLRMAITGKS